MKKRILACLLMIIIVFSTTATAAVAVLTADVTAKPTASTVLVNGESVSFDAYNINDNNYFKLRDLAYALSGTEKQFEVSWEGTANAIILTSDSPYTAVGGEMTGKGEGNKTAMPTNSKIIMDNEEVQFTAYNIEDNNYFKLRDIGAAFDFGVDWDGANNTIVIDTGKGYTPDETTPPALTDDLVVHYIDVGQADSILIQLPNGQTMLIDGGESNNASSILSYMRSLNITTIDYLIATHPHSDHIGGLPTIIDSIDIGSVYMPRVSHTTQTFERLLTAIQNKGLQIDTAKAGVDILSEPDLQISIVAPVNETYSELNDYSAVIMITYSNNTFLFMGDAEVLSESHITADVSADVLKVGHHGSDTSTSAVFLQKVSPDYAVISVGSGNSYGHPSDSTLSRLNDAGIKIGSRLEQRIITKDFEEQMV